MFKPLPQNYGLSPQDIARLDQLEQRIESFSLIGGGLVGAIAGFLIGVSGQSLGTALFCAFWGGIFGAAIVVSLVGFIARNLAPQVGRYSHFKAALKKFDDWDRRTRTEFWQSLSGRRFELELADVFKREGYDVELTPSSGDHGIDIVLKRLGRTTIVQCKQTKHRIGPAVARELYGALIATKADDGILATIGGVTPGVHQFFKGKPLRVMDLSEILRLHKRDPGKTH
jgi:hypothetical protein